VRHGIVKILQSVAAVTGFDLGQQCEVWVRAGELTIWAV